MGQPVQSHTVSPQWNWYVHSYLCSFSIELFALPEERRLDCADSLQHPIVPAGIVPGNMHVCEESQVADGPALPEYRAESQQSKGMAEVSEGSLKRHFP